MNLDPLLTNAQIAFALAVIAIVVAYYVFAKKPTKSKRS